MANLMGITNPVPNYDATTNNRALPNQQKPTDPSVQNIVDPARVVRTDGKTEQRGAGNAFESNVLRYDSGFGQFLSALREAPDLAAEMMKMITMLRSMVVTPGLNQGLSQEMAAFLSLIQMDEAGFKKFFLNQMETGSRFQGSLFALLRNVYRQSGNEGVKEDILTFLKRYSDFSSTGHIGDTMLSLLNQISERTPSAVREQLLTMIARLQNDLAAGSRQEALKLLKQEILPHVKGYIERYHDFGQVRTLVGMLSLQLTRYENGDEEGLLQAFRQLGCHGNFLSGLNELEDDAVFKLLSSGTYEKALEQDAFSRQLSSLAGAALRGETGSDLKEIFTEIVRAMLMNESVYMPLRHGMIPLQWQDRMMYSEFWVDPDAEGEQQGKQGDSDGKIQFLFKMDIGELGYFDMTLAARGTEVDLAVYGPETVAQHQKIVEEDLKEILLSHGLSCKKIQVEHSEQPLAITDVFKGLFEGRGGVNVRI